MARPSAIPHSGGGGRGGGRAGAEGSAVLRAWSYEVKPGGTSHLMGPPTGRPAAHPRRRLDVLAGRDGLFRDADWFPRLGGPDRTLANHLAAFHRLVELRTITLRRACEWAVRHDVGPYVIIDRQLVPPR